MKTGAIVGVSLGVVVLLLIGVFVVISMQNSAKVQTAAVQAQAQAQAATAIAKANASTVQKQNDATASLPWAQIIEMQKANNQPTNAQTNTALWLAGINAAGNIAAGFFAGRNAQKNTVTTTEVSDGIGDWNSPSWSAGYA